MVLTDDRGRSQNSLLASVSEAIKHLPVRPPSWHAKPDRPAVATPLAVPKLQLRQPSRDGSARLRDLVVQHHLIHGLVAARVAREAHKVAVLLTGAVACKLAAVGHGIKSAQQQRQHRRQQKQQSKPARAGVDLHHLSGFWRRRRGQASDKDPILSHFGGKEAEARALVKLAQQHQRDCNVQAALNCLEEANQLHPGDSHTLALLSKQHTDLMYLPELPGSSARWTDAQKRSMNERALTLAEQAIAAAPSHALPHVAASISMGRMALVTPENRAKVELARRAREAAHNALRLDPASDLAHHLIGRWHYEMAGVNWAVRTLVRMMYGTALAPGTYEEAAAAYSRAVALAPTRLVHRVELGRCYQRLGDGRRALQELEAANGLDVEDINARLTKLDAEEMLAQLRSQQRSPFLGLPTLLSQQQQEQQRSAGGGPQLPPALA